MPARNPLGRVSGRDSFGQSFVRRRAVSPHQPTSGSEVPVRALTKRIETRSRRPRRRMRAALGRVYAFQGILNSCPSLACWQAVCPYDCLGDAKEDRPDSCLIRTRRGASPPATWTARRGSSRLAAEDMPPGNSVMSGFLALERGRDYALARHRAALALLARPSPTRARCRQLNSLTRSLAGQHPLTSDGLILEPLFHCAFPRSGPLGRPPRSGRRDGAGK